MNRFIFLILSLIGFGSASMHAQILGFSSGASSDIQAPGPSQALFNSPYYSCTRNFYVSTTGSDSNSGTSSGSPWLTIAHYESGATSPTGGDCINVASGTYAAGNENMTKSGTLASKTGYIVYRCTVMDACTITDSAVDGGAFNAGYSASGQIYVKYLIFDGFTFASSPQSGNNGVAVNCYNNDSISNGQCHHWWVINSIINWYGQSGIQLNDGEYFFAFHNTIYQTSHDCQAAQGSGISFATLKTISGYSPTSDDISNPTMGLYGTNNPFHAMASFNIIYNVYIGCTSLGGNSDGNGIILDGNGNTAGEYTPQTLFSFNVVYNNGGNGIHIFGADSGNATVANNSCYNTNLDLYNNATARYCFGDNASFGGNTFINNIAYAIPGASGVTDANSAFCLCGSSGAALDTATSNITICSINPPPGQSDCNPVYNSNTFSSSSNKVNTNPLWVNVGNSSSGSESTQPAEVNFALQGGSAAISYGQMETYLPAQAIDSGACYHTLGTCP